MTRLRVVPFPAALDALQFYTGYAGGWTPFERRRDAVRAFWRPSTAPGLASLIRGLDERYGDEIAMGLPQRARFNGGVGQATVLWCWVEGSDQVRRATRFRPLPTMAITAGSSRRLLLWALERPATYFHAYDANKRIAYHLRAKQVDGDPDRLRIPLPGTCLRVGRRRPAAVVCSRLTLRTFPDWMSVAGELRDPPEPAKWWEGRSAR